MVSNCLQLIRKTPPSGGLPAHSPSPRAFSFPLPPRTAGGGEACRAGFRLQVAPTASAAREGARALCCALSLRSRGAPVPHGRKPRTSVHAACRPAPPPARNASLPPAVRVRACAARCHLHRRPCLPVSSPRARGREPCSSWAVGITTQVSLQLAAPCSGRGGAWPAVSRCSRRARGPRGRR